MAQLAPTAAQKNLLTTLENSTSEFSQDWDPVRGGLAFARAAELATDTPVRDAAGEEREAGRLAGFLERYGDLFGVRSGLKDLSPLRRRRDDLGFTHLTYQQRVPTGTGRARRDLEVYGSKLAAHFDAGGRLVEVQSSVYADPTPVNSLKVTAEELAPAVLRGIRRVKGFKELAAQQEERGEKLFPLAQEPVLVIYPWQERMILAWQTYGYSLLPPELHEPGEEGDVIAFGQMFFDAETGELFLFAPTRRSAETATTGTGRGTLPLGGPYASRSLNVVRLDTTNTYRLKNTTKARPIITFDANANSSWVYPSIPSLLDAGTIPVSEDTDGDHDWDRTATSTTDAQRTASQQPEVDEHATVSDLYDWYAAIGGRVGWDDDGFTAPLVPDQNINVVAHTYDSGAGTSRSINAFFDSALVSGHWVAHLAFFDGDPTNTTNPYDYLAGSKAIVAHEYQHAVTDFSFVDGSGNPGLSYTDWLAAVHEGLSDVFGGLYSGEWWMGKEISSTGLIFRNLAFPRDTTCFDTGKFDHWDDRNTFTGTGARYERGDILAHAAYLMAQGGVHLRVSRTPERIPVRGMGMETVGGRSVYKAARIYYRAVSEYLSNVGAATGIPANDENVFRTIRNGCVSAAIDLYGANSAEHKTTILAWHAVGLDPVGTPYGADCTFLTWGWDWRYSRPYVGMTSPDWASRDLFINNGGTSEWNAQINVNDSMGNPTQFENLVYFRVRNVGTATATNVQVQFDYTKISPSGANWVPVTDKTGTIQTMNIGSLAGGLNSFSDADQNTPPSTSSVKWWIPPLGPGETVDHYCLRARVFSIDDVNPHNSEVQSNIAYVPWTPSLKPFDFWIVNELDRPDPMELLVSHTFPRGWGLGWPEPWEGVVLKPGERRLVQAVVTIPEGSDRMLEAPFDGRLRGELEGEGGFGGKVDGVLSDSRMRKERFEGVVALTDAEGSQVNGWFTGKLDAEAGRLDGVIEGTVQTRGGGEKSDIRARFSGCLRPERVLNIAQVVDGEAIGGLSIQVQVPLPPDSCFDELPPTSTMVDEAYSDGSGVSPDDAAKLIEKLRLDPGRVVSTEIRSVTLEVKFRGRD